MYQVKFTEKKKLDNFLRVNEIDFIDAIFTDDQLQLISDSNEFFAIYTVSCRKSMGQQPFSFRIPKKILQFCDSSDVLAIDLVNGEIKVTFINEHGQVGYECEFVQQILSTYTYSDKQELVETEYAATIDGTKFEALYQIARLCGGVVTVEGGAASVIMREGPRVYMPFSLKESFSFSYKAFETLKKCSSQFFNVGNYLGAADGSFKVLVRKSRLGSNDEYQLLKSGKFGARLTGEIGLGPMFRFLQFNKIDSDVVEFDLDERCCKLDAMFTRFKIPIILNGLAVAPGTTAGKIQVPVAVLNKILKCTGDYFFRIRILKNFVQFSTDSYDIVW